MGACQPTSGSARALLVVPADLAWDVDWSGWCGTAGAERVDGPARSVRLASDSGPECCCECGALVLTDVLARVGVGETTYDKRPPPLNCPDTVRRVPWAKALIQPGASACHDRRRVTWTDLGRTTAVANPQACLSIYGAQNLDDGLRWVLNPQDGVVIDPGVDGAVWSVWLSWQIGCCQCYEDAPARLMDMRAVPDADEVTFLAPPNATSFTLFMRHQILGSAYDLDILDAAGNVLWSTTTTAAVYSVRWPEAYALRVRADRNSLVTIVWETA